MKNLLAYILLIVSAVAKATMDIIALGQWSGWWNKAESWCNKWHNCIPGDEAFFGSSTFLVWLTDGWHAMQMVFLNTLIVGLLLYQKQFKNIWWDILIIAIAYKIVFEIAFRLIKGIG